MTRDEFKNVMLNVVIYYGGEKNFEPVHMEALFKAFERFEVEYFREHLWHIYEHCKFPPRLADFIEANKALKNKNFYKEPKKFNEQIEADPSFPDEALIKARTEELKALNPKLDVDYVNTIMATMVRVMKATSEEYKNFGRGRKRN